MNWKHLVSWIPGIPIAIVNGLIRTSLYVQFLTELHAHKLSAVSFIVLFGIYGWFALKWLNLSSGKEAPTLGLTWLILTAVCEFLFGRFVMGHPWANLFHDYNLLAGRVWIFVLIWITAAPIIFCRLQLTSGRRYASSAAPRRNLLLLRSIFGDSLSRAPLDTAQH